MTPRMGSSPLCCDSHRVCHFERDGWCNSVYRHLGFFSGVSGDVSDRRARQREVVMSLDPVTSACKAPIPVYNFAVEDNVAFEHSLHHSRHSHLVADDLRHNAVPCLPAKLQDWLLVFRFATSARGASTAIVSGSFQVAVRTQSWVSHLKEPPCLILRLLFFVCRKLSTYFFLSAFSCARLATSAVAGEFGWSIGFGG